MIWEIDTQSNSFPPVIHTVMLLDPVWKSSYSAHVINQNWQIFSTPFYCYVDYVWPLLSYQSIGSFDVTNTQSCWLWTGIFVFKSSPEPTNLHFHRAIKECLRSHGEEFEVQKFQVTFFVIKIQLYSRTWPWKAKIKNNTETQNFSHPGAGWLDTSLLRTGVKDKPSE